jgi:hypothetical protein
MIHLNCPFRFVDPVLGVKQENRHAKETANSFDSSLIGKPSTWFSALLLWLPVEPVEGDVARREPAGTSERQIAQMAERSFAAL